MHSNFPKIPLFLSIVFFLVSCSLFFTLYREVSNNNAEAEESLKEWQTEASQRDDLRELDSFLRGIEKEKTELETHFIKSSNVVPFLNALENMAESTGAEAHITSVAVSPDKAFLAVGAKASGTFTALYAFIRLLENSPYELEITSVDLSKAADPAGRGAGWTLSLGVKLISFVP